MVAQDKQKAANAAKTSLAPTPAVEAVSVASVAKKTEQALPRAFWLWGLFKDELDFRQARPDESFFYEKYSKLIRLVRIQAIVIAVFVVFLVVVGPMLQPIYDYKARTSGREPKFLSLVALAQPNLTDRAILSWVATSITEILTYGFGDFDQRIMSQKKRFTPEGWEGFLKEIREKDMRTQIKAEQLVLTTAPSDAPVIVAKGFDADMEYTWTVEMPIIMTYATNNNVTKGERRIVRLILARVPSSLNRAGLGIKEWRSM